MRRVPPALARVLPLALALLAGCGQTGPLALPPSARPAESLPSAAGPASTAPPASTPEPATRSAPARPNAANDPGDEPDDEGDRERGDGR